MRDIHVDRRFLDVCRWCRDTVGADWGYRARDFYFRDSNAAVAFKLRWG